MRQYQVYNHPIKGLEIVKDGFSWPGFFFGFYWAIIKRIWFLVLGYSALILIGISMKADGAGDNTFSFLGLCAALAVGIWGNRWRGKTLKRHGYEIIASVDAPTRDAAIAMAMRKAQNPN